MSSKEQKLAEAVKAKAETKKEKKPTCSIPLHLQQWVTPTVGAPAPIHPLLVQAQMQGVLKVTKAAELPLPEEWAELGRRMGVKTAKDSAKAVKIAEQYDKAAMKML